MESFCIDIITQLGINVQGASGKLLPHNCCSMLDLESSKRAPGNLCQCGAYRQHRCFMVPGNVCDVPHDAIQVVSRLLFWTCPNVLAARDCAGHCQPC